MTYFLDIVKIFFGFWDPPTTKKKKSKNFTYGVVGIKIGQLGWVELIAEGLFEKKIQK